jgi:hypothetical protein
MTLLHPEHLLERARAGIDIGESDRALLDAHLARCSACAMHVQLAHDFDAMPLDIHDAAAVERLVERASAGFVSMDQASRPSPSPVRASRPAYRALLWAAAAMGTAFLASGGAATAYFALRPAPLATVWTADAPPPDRRAPKRRTARAEVAPVEPPEAAVAPVIDVPARELAPALSPRAERPRRPARSSLGAHTEPAPSGETRETRTAAELLHAANRERRTGHLRDAAALHRQLQREHATTREASVSRIALGRLLLDDLRDPAAAHRLFALYLAQDPDGVLALEARVGAAVALERLGRHAGAARAWEAVLRHHPESVHAGRARARRDALSSR